MKISATIITFNEAENIRAACESVRFADEIIVVDSGSTDQTREIAESCGVKVLIQEWKGFARQKQFAAANAKNDWIFSLDADERASPELVQKIFKLKELPEEKVAEGYRIARKNFYMNRWIRGGGWYPDWQLRFYNRTKAVWKDVLIHESVQLNSDARLEYLRGGDILHYSIENAAYHHRMIGERYAPLAARQMFESGRRTTRLKIATAGFTAFLQTYFLKAGFRDGLPGFCIARFAAHHAFLKHLLLWEMQTNAECGIQGAESEETPRPEFRTPN